MSYINRVRLNGELTIATCRRCAALVAEVDTVTHDAWHERLEDPTYIEGGSGYPKQGGTWQERLADARQRQRETEGDFGAGLRAPEPTVTTPVAEGGEIECRAKRWNGVPSFDGPHGPHFFTYGPGDMYTGSCAGRIAGEGGEAGEWFIPRKPQITYTQVAGEGGEAVVDETDRNRPTAERNVSRSPTDLGGAL